MRDPERIERILAILRVYWLQYPDMRLGQIVENARRLSDVNDLYHTFSVSDDDMEMGLRAMARQANEWRTSDE